MYTPAIGSTMQAVQSKLNQAANAIQLKAGISQTGPMGLDMQPGVPGVQSFNNVLMNSMNQVNDTVVESEKLMEDYLKGGQVDIHDVMIAGAKSELAVSMTSRTITRVIQAYEKITQIQV